MTAQKLMTVTTTTATTTVSIDRSIVIRRSLNKNVNKIQRVLLDKENENNKNKADEETEQEHDNDNKNNDNDKENAYNIKTQCIPGSHEVIPSSLYEDKDVTTLEEILTISSNSNNNNNMKTLDIKTTPETFLVHIRTSINNTKDNIIIFKIKRSWSPIGVDQFYQLMNDNYYNCAAFFRVVPEFVIQFGIASEPNETYKWDQIPIIDDPIGIQSNTIGTISYATAGPNTRTTQLFINMNNNSALDLQGFTPIGKVIQGMNILEQFLYNPTPGDSNGIDQYAYTTNGNEWILKEYPNVDIILNTSLIVELE